MTQTQRFLPPDIFRWPQLLDYSVLFFFYAFMLVLPVSKGATSVAMVALGILSLVQLVQYRLSLWRLIRRHLPIALLALPFLAYLLSLFYTQNLAAGGKFINREISLLLMPLIVLIQREFVARHLRWLLLFFITAVCVNALVTLLFYLLPEASAIQLADAFRFIGVKPYQQLHLREAFGVYSPFMVRIQFSNLLALGCLSALWLYVQQVYKQWMLAALALMLVTSVILGGRGGQLGLMLALGCWVLGGYFMHLHPRLKQKVGTAGSVGVLLGILLTLFVLLPLLAYHNIPALRERYNQLIWEMKLLEDGTYREHDYVHFTSLRRLISYQNSWELIRRHPFTGTGVGDYQQEMEAIYAKNHPEFPVNSHNHLLFLWASSGLAGLLAFLFSLGYWLRSFLRSSRGWTRIYGLSLLLFFFSIMMLEAMFNQVDLMCYGLFLGMALIAAEEGRTE
ncbi:MAG: hypothetical protein D6730_02250 [Bacteroidetes bacterium]|nr:MAG: hypothetical protein D6730_02250 [Bacteroidota bacterium]